MNSTTSRQPRSKGTTLTNLTPLRHEKTNQTSLRETQADSRRALNEFCELAGIGHWSPNELRHSFASLMSLSDAPMEEVADAMGHVDTRMTSQVYRHNLKSVVDVAESRLNSLFTEPQE